MVAKKLPQRLFVVSNLVLFDKSDEVRRCISRQGGLGKVRIGRDEVFRLPMNIGEIAAAAAGDQDFLAQSVGAFNDRHAPATFSGFCGAEESCGTRAEDQHVKAAGHRICSSNMRKALLQAWALDVTENRELFGGFDDEKTMETCI